MVRNSQIKKISPEKVAILHVCTQEEQIRKLSEILVGNGHPEDGYVYKVIEVCKEVKDINNKLTGITGIVKELHEESIGKKAIGKTDQEKKIEKRAELLKIVQTCMLIIVIIGLCITTYFGFRGNKKQDTIMINQDVIKKRQDNLGVPVIVNKRGEVMAVPDSTKILYFNNDSMRYLIKRIGK